MAVLRAFNAFSNGYINYFPFEQDITALILSRNSNLTVEGNTYPDSITEEYWDPLTYPGGSMAKTVFYGEQFALFPDGLRFDGTVKAIEQFSSSESKPDFVITDLNIAADLFRSVYGPPPTAATLIFSENDRVYLSNQGDYFFAGDGNDIVYGYAGKDYIDSGNGNDKVYAGAGNDLIESSGTGKDVVDGGTGFDTFSFTGSNASITLDLNSTGRQSLAQYGSVVLKGIEAIATNSTTDKLIGNDAANSFVSGDGTDILIGNGGNDWLDGAAGADTLTGGTGKDRFVLTNLPATKALRDKITDFSHAEGDRIVMNASDVFGRGSIAQPLDYGVFYAAPGAKSAHDASDRLVYNTTTGVLSLDADGKGGAAAIEIVELTRPDGTHPDLNNADFVLI